MSLYSFTAKYSYEKLPNGYEKISYATEDNSYTVNFLASGAEFGLIADALIESTFINHITGEPFNIMNIFNRYIFTHAIKVVDFPDNPEIKSFNVSDIDINNQNYNLIKIIIKAWRKDTI